MGYRKPTCVEVGDDDDIAHDKLFLSELETLRTIKNKNHLLGITTFIIMG